MSDGTEGQLQLDTMPNWLKTPAAGETAAPVAAAPVPVEPGPASNPAAAWLAPDDRTAPEPSEAAEQPGDGAITGAAALLAWAGPTAGEPVRPIAAIVGPDPAPAPIREPGDDPAPDDQPGEGEEGEDVDPRVDMIAGGLLLFKRLWQWPPGTQNEADAATEFAEFIVGVVEEFKPKAGPDGNQPQ